jgi:C1A family cysteine protease
MFKDFLSLLERGPLGLINVNLRAKFPAIWNQLNLGACQSFAMDAVLCALLGIPWEPSHLYTYYNVREAEGTVGEDTGGTLSGTIDSVKLTGICNSSLWPYAVSKFRDKPPQACYDAAGHKIGAAHRATSIDELRQALDLGFTPYIGINVYPNFEAAKTMSTGIIPKPAGKPIGGHALVLDGAKDDDTPRCKALNFVTSVIIKHSTGDFEIRNSWGPNIGLQGSGYFQTTYENLEEMLMDAWVVAA